MNFSESIKKILKDRDLTPSALARMTGYTPQHIHDLLAGNRRWNETTISKTCEALGIEILIVPKDEKKTI
ncbi:helix-turn-helix domain-containing protein [Thermaerobacillus caldiproteolyticus]|uniref:helix-turn-helix domain-containing protein n=1 Tax=Thermaerobacillus caldiproteolyticus TaxID=247480 RepID=UPI0018F1C754|nr:helix-turn-helix transcriptional regulator [Anoxybacillus caldiproteolyticus]